MKNASLCMLFLLSLPAAMVADAAGVRHRLIVLADMGNEPDEEQQMMHLLVCANEVELEGLVAVTGLFLRKKVRPDLFHKLVDGYAKVEKNLRKHADGWPTAKYLRSIVASGQPTYGIAAVGAGKASGGSKLIVRAVEKDDPRPINVVVNAGSNTLAQALRDLRESVSPEKLKAYVAKLRVYENGAQDNAGAWICHEFPAIHWVRSNRQTYAYGGPSFDGKKPGRLGPHTWKPYPYSPDGQHAWAKEHIQTGHGSLGALYPDRRFRRGLAYLEGGGTTPWLGLINRGLYDVDRPAWGGWGGRFTATKQKNVWSRHKFVRATETDCADFFCYTETTDVWIDPDSKTEQTNIFTPVWRWRQAMFNDLRVRMDWCVASRDQANHHPVAGFRGDKSDSIIRIKAKPGEKIALDASGSSDPDGDKLRFGWWVYAEAGGYDKFIVVPDPDAAKTSLAIPSDAKGKQIHVILEVRDDRKEVSLYDYRRIVIDVS